MQEPEVMGVEWKTVLLLATALIGLYLVLSAIARPFQLVLRLGVCLVVGFVLLSLANLILGQWGMELAINPVTLLTAGVLQIPGVVLLVVLQGLFVQ